MRHYNPLLIETAPNYIPAQTILCLVILELWLPDKYSFVVFLLWQKTNLTIFKRNCFTLVLRILITIIPAAVLNRHKIIYGTNWNLANQKNCQHTSEEKTNYFHFMLIWHFWPNVPNLPKRFCDLDFIHLTPLDIFGPIFVQKKLLARRFTFSNLQNKKKLRFISTKIRPNTNESVLSTI